MTSVVVFDYGFGNVRSMVRALANLGLDTTLTSDYRQALEAGIAKEQARALLPEGLTPSRMYITGTLRSWIHYIDLRTDASTQKEHRQIAEACKALVAEQFPGVAAAVWRDAV